MYYRRHSCLSITFLRLLAFVMSRLLLGGGLVNLGDCVPWLFSSSLTEVMIAITDRSFATSRFELSFITSASKTSLQAYLLVLVA